MKNWNCEERTGGMRMEAFRIALLFGFLALDQWTKWLARATFSIPGTIEPDYFKVQPILGEWLQFRLVYNFGAAFGLKPQNYVPFLNPTVFYALFSAVAILFLLGYYRKLAPSEAWQKAGVALILSGAFGNLIDRLKFQKVTDFIDVGIPGWETRWPTFNIADSCVCVGVFLILFAPLFTKRGNGAGPEAAAAVGGPAVPEAGSAGPESGPATPTGEA